MFSIDPIAAVRLGAVVATLAAVTAAELAYVAVADRMGLVPLIGKDRA